MNPILAWFAFAMGAYLCVLNFHQSFLSYFLHRFRGGAKETYRCFSVIPLFGSLLVGVSLTGLHDVPGMLTASLVLLILDTGGPLWFAFVLIRELLQSLWNRVR